MNFENFYHNDLFPRGQDKDNFQIDFNPSHIATKSFEHNVFDIIMSKKDEIFGQEFSVEYSYMDFRPMNYQRKIDQVI